MEYRLKKAKDFDRVFKAGKRAFTNRLTLIYLPAKTVKAGYAVGKKHGKAVKRNRIKRLLRESIRPRIPQMKCGYYVFIARSAAEEADFHRIDKSVDNLLTRHHLYKSVSDEQKA